MIIYISFCFCPQGTGISEEVFRQIETVQNRYDSSTAAAFRAVQKSGEMVVRTLDPRQFIRLASETAPKINIDTNVSPFFLNLYFAHAFSILFFRETVYSGNQHIDANPHLKKLIQSQYMYVPLDIA